MRRDMTLGELVEDRDAMEDLLLTVNRISSSADVDHAQSRIKATLTDPEPSTAREQTDLYIQSDGRDMTVWHDDKPLLTEHQAGPVLWAHLVATLPTRDEPQPEPLDPGVRVRDVTGDDWARIGEVWVNTNGGNQMWDALVMHLGPLEIRHVNMRAPEPVTPAPEPTPDERPFEVGDLVRVADDALNLSGFSSRWRGDVGRVAGSVGRDGFSVEFNDAPGNFFTFAAEYLTHADAPC